MTNFLPPRNPRLAANLVAQTFGLPYHRLSACERRKTERAVENDSRSRLQVGDTADGRSALQFLVLVLTFFFIAPLAHGHPGHGLLDQGTSHLITSPYHLLVLLASGLLLAAAARFVRSCRLQWLMRATGAAFLLLAAAFWTLGG